MATGSRRGAGPPGPIYVDASALVKLYLPEPESDELNRALTGRSDLVVSDLAVTEIASSLSRRRREGEIDGAVVGRLYRTLLRHIEDGFYRRVELVPATHREAERLLLSLEGIPLRAADALHLALAVAVEAGSVLTYDGRLARAAQALGLIASP